MTKGRLEAFSDGVIAIIITVMVPGLRLPAGAGPAPLRPPLLSCALGFVLLGIYWSNHHHLLLRILSRRMGRCAVRVRVQIPFTFTTNPSTTP